MGRFLIVLLCAALPAAPATLAISQGGPALPGEAVEVVVTLAAVEPVAGVSFGIEYDGAALSIKPRAGASATAASKALHTFEPSPGKLRMIAFGAGQKVFGDGPVAALTVTVKTSAAASFPLKLVNAAATDLAGSPIAVTTVDGRILTESSRPRITSIAHAGTSQPVIPAGGWFELSGTQFAASQRAWTEADFVGGRLPERLLSVAVEIGGKPGYLAFVGPDRLEVLAPAFEADGEVSVRVRAPQGDSDTFPALVNALAPGFFAAPDSGGRYVLATREDGSPAGTNVFPVRPGETVSLVGTGFGPTLPQAPEGTLPAVAPLAAPVAITIAGEPAEVPFAGIVAPGRYQFNVVVPENAPAGDQEISAEIGGVRSPPGRYIAVEVPEAIESAEFSEP